METKQEDRPPGFLRRVWNALQLKEAATGLGYGALTAGAVILGGVPGIIAVGATTIATTFDLCSHPAGRPPLKLFLKRVSARCAGTYGGMALCGSLLQAFGGAAPPPPGPAPVQPAAAQFAPAPKFH